MKLDAIDRKILRILQQDGQIQNQSLAERVGLSPSPCHRRVRALEQAGIIRGYVALIDGNAVGAGFVAWLEVRLQQQGASYAARFEKAVGDRPEVLECLMITGDYDYLMKIAVADLDEFRRFLTDVVGRIEGVANLRTAIPLKAIKQTTALRVD